MVEESKRQQIIDNIRNGKPRNEVTGGLLEIKGASDSGVLFEDAEGNVDIKNKKEISDMKKSAGNKAFGDIESDRLKKIQRRFDTVKELITPPYEMETLTKLPLINTWHNKCIQIKATDVVGKGINLVLVEDGKENENEKQMLKDFVEKAPEEGKTFLQIVRNWVIDRMTTGNGALELGRTAEIVGDGQRMPSLLAHIPFYTLRPHQDGKRWCHYLAGESSDKVWFKRFGVEQEYDKEDGSELDGFNSDNGAHELMLLQNFMSINDYYGIPEIISAVSAIVGAKYEREYNLQFFENNAVPRYAIIVRGGLLSASLKTSIKDYFTREIKNNMHSTLYIEIPAEDPGAPKIEVDFKELDVKQKDSSFRLYRKDLVSEVMIANGMPPYKLGIPEQGGLGGNLGTELIDNYVHDEIEPLQTDAEDMLYLITKSFAPNYMIKFKDLDIRDEERLMKISTTYVEKTIWSINEARELTGKEGIGPSGDKVYMFTNQGAIEIGDTTQSKLKNKYSKKIRELEEELNAEDNIDDSSK